MPGVKGRSGGRNRKPVEAHLRDGTFEPSRHGSEPHVTAPKGWPAKPSYLSAVAAAMWDQLATIMEREGRLTVNDGPFLEEASDSYSQYVRWRVAAENAPLTQTKVTVDSAGNEHRVEQVHPSQVQFRLASEDWRKKQVEGGFTPTARSRVKLPEQPKEVDEFAAFQQAKPSAARHSVN